MAAKTKSIALRNLNHSFLSSIKRKVYFRVKSRIISKVIDGWRDDIIFNRQYSCNSFNCAGSTKQVARSLIWLS